MVVGSGGRREYPCWPPWLEPICSLCSISVYSNYMLGVGALGMPYAFYKSGIIVGVILTFVCSLMSYLTTVWVAHAAFRVKQGRKLAKGNPFESPKQLKKKQPSDETSSLVGESKIMSIYRSLSGALGDGSLLPKVGPQSEAAERKVATDFEQQLYHQQSP